MTEPVQIEGFARCVNPACFVAGEDGTQESGMFDVDRPVALVRETVQQKGYPGEAFSSMVITESTYIHPADDADLICPSCGQPCALLDRKPVVYPKAAIR